MINEFYQRQENRQGLPRMFCQNEALPSITLRKFLDNDSFHALQEQLQGARFIVKKNPMAFSYSISKKPIIDFAGKECIGLISLILGKKIRKIDGAWHCLGWKDYTLLNDEKIEKPGIDLIFDATPVWESAWGGYVVYTNGRGNSIPLAAAPNSLFIVQRKNAVQKFIKYVNNKAKKNNRYLFLARLER